ncbi:MAG: hypothetical protein ACOWYE_08850, partial [Desulfatiglandales bacterium]
HLGCEVSQEGNMRDHRKLRAFELADADPEMSIPGFAITAFSLQLSAISDQLSAKAMQRQGMRLSAECR